jgi:hypothetical protein
MVSNRSKALGNFDDNVEINWAWNSIRENIKYSTQQSLGYQRFKLLDQRK